MWSSNHTVNLWWIIDFQAATSFVNTNGGFLASTNVLSPHMSSWHMPEHMTGSHGGDTLSSSLNDSYLSSYFARSATASADVHQVSSLANILKSHWYGHLVAFLVFWHCWLGRKDIQLVKTCASKPPGTWQCKWVGYRDSRLTQVYLEIIHENSVCMYACVMWSFRITCFYALLSCGHIVKVKVAVGLLTGSWLAWTNDIAANYMATHCPR